MTSVEATLLGVGIAAIAMLLGFLTYLLSRGLLPLTPSAKLWDRVYELDKLVLTYSDIFTVFMEQASRKTPYFYADPTDVKRDADYYKLKAMVYFHLNVFEEIYLTTEGSVWIFNQFEREGRDKYIFRKMRHPLVREIFLKEAKEIYPGKFTEFIYAHEDELKKPYKGLAF